MPFEQLDSILKPWVEKHGLHLLTEHKDEPVRATIIVDDSGDSYGLGVSEPKQDGSVEVLVYKPTHGGRTLMGKRMETRALKCDLARLRESLDEAYSIVETWMQSSEHTRTPV